MSKLPTYGGFTQDNLSVFIDDLSSYYSVKNITEDNRKILILWAQLQHAAKLFTDDTANSPNPPTTFDQWMQHITQKFITPDIIVRHWYDFYNISQGASELPHDLAAQLQEATHLASFQQPWEIMEAMFI